MFNFFQTIIHKAALLFASAITVVGLISVPAPQAPAVVNSQAPVTQNQKSDQTKERVIIKTVNDNKEIEQLKKEIQDLKNSKQDKPIVNQPPITTYYPVKVKEPELPAISAQDFVDGTRLISTSSITRLVPSEHSSNMANYNFVWKTDYFANFITYLNSDKSKAVSWSSQQKEIDLKNYGVNGYVYTDFICSDNSANYQYSSNKAFQDVPFLTCNIWATINGQKARGEPFTLPLPTK